MFEVQWVTIFGQYAKDVREYTPLMIDPTANRQSYKPAPQQVRFE